MNESDPDVLNESVLDELSSSVQGDRSFVVELIEAYLADGESHVADVEAAVAAGDAPALVRPAHTLKSSSATVGAERLAALARILETAGRSGTLDTAAGEHVAGLRQAWGEAGAMLRAWIERGGGS
ncbi:MAG: Hpt domain-containing protein [Chloroflexi bacterium]|nr:Hpt domain-containing protein [Chloroflexota bacterium]